MKEIEQHIIKALSRELPGEAAHIEMAPLDRLRRADALRKNKNPRNAAVLALFYQKADVPHFVLILRNTYKGVHSAQVGFPGGKPEQVDTGLEATALRETEEEVGVLAGKIEVLGKLSEVYIPPSGFLVHPFIGITRETPLFTPDPHEVKQIIEVPLRVFLDDAILRSGPVPIGNGMKMESPYFLIDDYIVWGATAMMLSEIRFLLKGI